MENSNPTMGSMTGVMHTMMVLPRYPVHHAELNSTRPKVYLGQGASDPPETQGAPLEKYRSGI